MENKEELVIETKEKLSIWKIALLVILWIIVIFWVFWAWCGWFFTIYLTISILEIWNVNVRELWDYSFNLLIYSLFSLIIWLLLIYIWYNWFRKIKTLTYKWINKKIIYLYIGIIILIIMRYFLI